MSVEVNQVTKETLIEGFKNLQKEWNAEPDNAVNLAVTKLRNALAKKRALTSSSKYNVFSKAISKNSSSDFWGFKRNANAQLKLEVYEACNEILDVLLMRNTSLNYAVYYTDSDGTVYRKIMDTVNENNISHHSGSTVNMLRSQIRDLYQQDIQSQIALNKHYTTYHNIIALTYRGTIGKGAVNNGHIAEAFERHLRQQDPDYFTDEINFQHTEHFEINAIWQNVRDSLNNAGWWTGGDVGMTQVKSMIGSSSAKVRISRVKTIEEVANLLLFLYDNRFMNLDEMNPFIDPSKSFLDYLVNYFSEHPRNSSIDEQIENTSEKETKEIIQKAASTNVRIY